MKKYIISEEQLNKAVELKLYIEDLGLEEYKEPSILPTGWIGTGDEFREKYGAKPSKKSLHERETIAAEKTAEAVEKMAESLKITSAFVTGVEGSKILVELPMEHNHDRTNRSL